MFLVMKILPKCVIALTVAINVRKSESRQTDRLKNLQCFCLAATVSQDIP